jgi:3-phenylpropionate/trans-cinnamate dioxygenase ferredoxin component
MTDFVTVATTDELQPGDEPIVVEIGRHWVAVYNVDGQYYAIDDVCTHDGGPLAEGEQRGHVVECPRHGAQFDVRTGQVLTAPAYTDVPAYEVRVEGDEIQVGPHKKKANQ